MNKHEWNGPVAGQRSDNSVDPGLSCGEALFVLIFSQNRRFIEKFLPMLFLSWKAEQYSPLLFYKVDKLEQLNDRQGPGKPGEAGLPGSWGESREPREPGTLTDWLIL